MDRVSLVFAHFNSSLKSIYYWWWSTAYLLKISLSAYPKYEFRRCEQSFVCRIFKQAPNVDMKTVDLSLFRSAYDWEINGLFSIRVMYPFTVVWKRLRAWVRLRRDSSLSYKRIRELFCFILCIRSSFISAYLLSWNFRFRLLCFDGFLSRTASFCLLRCRRGGRRRHEIEETL